MNANYRLRSEKILTLAEIGAKERLRSQKYLEDVLEAFTILQNAQSGKKKISKQIILMDIAWQISGKCPTENDLATAFYPIQGFFWGTIFQDDLLDSLDLEHPRPLVEHLGSPMCMIMGNILYCESLLSLLEYCESRDSCVKPMILKSLEKMVNETMNAEIYRRNYIGKILSSGRFFDIWRSLTPNTACIEIGGIMGQSDKEKIKILTKIGSNLSIINRINKEMHEMHGLRGSIHEILRRKPPPFPITLAYESATPSEKKELKRTIKQLCLIKNKRLGINEEITNIKPLIDLIVKYNAFIKSLKIQKDLIDDTGKLISQIPDSHNRDTLNQLLGFNFLSKNNSENLLARDNIMPK